MKLLGFSLILFLVGLLKATHSFAKSYEYSNPTHLIMPDSSSLATTTGINCLSWRLAVETNNLRDWAPVPAECEKYMENYIMGGQYDEDCLFVTSAAYEYAEKIPLKKDGRNIWIFDIDDTALSNLPYYARPDVGFGTKPYNATSYNEWQEESKAPALPAVLSLYKKLMGLGIKIVFLSGTKEEFREPKERNLKEAGYYKWEMVILKQPIDSHLNSVDYKSKKRAKLEEMGYRIIGNMGDQWSDLQGTNIGMRIFKTPNPLYYLG